MKKAPDIKPLAFLVCGPKVLADLAKETDLEPGALRTLALIHAYQIGTSCNPNSPSLTSDWLSPRLVRGYIIKLNAKGYITRLPPRRRAARQLMLSPAGSNLLWRMERELREAMQALNLPT